MEHTPAAQIFSTKEYGRFRIINGNRSINEAKVNNLKYDINNGLDMLRECPVVVVEEDDVLRIIDGQHRFWVSKTMKKPVFYVITKNMPLHKIARMNSRTDKWKNDDYINCFLVQGNDSYQKLQAFMDKYNLPSSTALPLLAYGNTSQGSKRDSLALDMKQGVYKVNELDKATAVMEAVQLFVSFPAHKTRYFIGAIANLLAQATSIAKIAHAYATTSKGLTRAHHPSEYETQLKALI